jgi:hypothetical protein
MPRHGSDCASALYSNKENGLGLIEYEDANPEVRAVYDDIMATRKVDRVNNFWKAIARKAPVRAVWTCC